MFLLKVSCHLDERKTGAKLQKKHIVPDILQTVILLTVISILSSVLWINSLCYRSFILLPNKDSRSRPDIPVKYTKDSNI